MRGSRFVFSIGLVALTAAAQAASPTFLYEQDPTLLTTAVRVVVLTGAADDSPTKSGLTNLAAELMLRGTKKYSRDKFQSEIEKLGGTLSVGVSHDTIIFDGRVIRENTMPFLALVRECILQPSFPKNEFESLKKEILGSIAHKKNQNSRLGGLAVRKRLFEGTSLEHPVEGGLETLSKLSLDDVKRAYNDRVHQGNVLFAASGPLPQAELAAPLTKMWLELPDGARLGRRSIALRLPEKPELIVVDKSKTSTGSLLMGQAGITAQDKFRYELGVGNFAFGGEPLVSRLFKVIRGELGWTYQIGSTYHAMGSLSYQQGLFIISSTPSVEFTVKTMLKSLAMWNDYLKEGLKAAEMTLSSDSLVNSYPFEFDSADERLSKKLDSLLYDVPVLSVEQYTKKIQGIDNAAIKTALKDRQSPGRWVIAIVADAKEIAKQLEAEQKERPEAERIKIAKIYTPDEVLQ